MAVTQSEAKRPRAKRNRHGVKSRVLRQASMRQQAAECFARGLLDKLGVTLR